jgi:hypothetical protein
MPVEQASLCDLIEDKAAQYGIALRKLWRWALDAIVTGRLSPVLPEGQSLDTKFNHGGMWLTLRGVIRSACRTIEDRLPSNDNWAKTLKFDPAAFDSWLKKVLQAQGIAAHPKRPGGRKKTLRELAASFLADRYPDGIPDGTPLKTVVQNFEVETGRRISERTMRRAQGRA